LVIQPEIYEVEQNLRGICDKGIRAFEEQRHSST
jgi:hypothetical protein